MNKHLGSNFDDLLQEDGSLEEVTATAVKRVIAWQSAQGDEGAENQQSGSGR